MAEVLSWQNVSPYKRIVLSKRLSSSFPSHLPDPGDSRRNKIFPADSLDCDQNTRLKDALSFSYSMGDSGLGTSLSRDSSSLTQSSQSSRRCTKSTKSSRKESRSSLKSVGTSSFNSNPHHQH